MLPAMWPRVIGAIAIKHCNRLLRWVSHARPTLRNRFVGWVESARPTTHLPIFLVLVCAACLFFVQLGNHDLWASHEARAAQDAQYFLDTQHWGLLRLVDGTPEYQKPPLYYWLVAGVASLRGGQVDEVAVRLPAAIAGWLTVAAVMVFLLMRGRPRAAWIAGLTLATTHHFVSISRTGRIDVPLTCAMTLAILLAMEAQPWLAGICLAMAMMLKGPIGVVMAMVVIVASRLRYFEASLTAVIAVVLGLPWFIAVGPETDWAFWREFFWHHNLQRAAGLASDLATHPIWFYPLRGLIDGLPWSLALPMALWAAIQRWRDDTEMRLGLTGLAVIVGLLSLSQFKRADYLLPAYPAAAILIGCWAEQTKLRHYHAIVIGITLAANVAYQFIVVPNEDATHEKRSATALVRQHVSPGQQIVFFRVEDHLLAWWLGKPIATVREWENLDIWVAQSKQVYVLMPCDEVGHWPEQLRNGTLQEVERLEDRTERQRPRTWVLLRSRPNVEAHGTGPETTVAP